MASEVQICNLALSHLGAYSITSLTDSTRKESRECNILYDTARDSVLRDNVWSFATKRLALALLSDTYSGWTYAYQYPTDCLNIIRIHNDYTPVSNLNYCWNHSEYRDPGKVEFEVASDSALSNKIILTNKSDAELIYTGRVTDANMFDAEFIDALSWRLASELALPLKGSLQLSQSLFQVYLMKSGQARAASVNEGYNLMENDNAFVDAR